MNTRFTGSTAMWEDELKCKVLALANHVQAKCLPISNMFGDKKNICTM